MDSKPTIEAHHTRRVYRRDGITWLRTRWLSVRFGRTDQILEHRFVDVDRWEWVNPTPMPPGWGPPDPAEWHDGEPWTEDIDEDPGLEGRERLEAIIEQTHAEVWGRDVTDPPQRPAIGVLGPVTVNAVEIDGPKPWKYTKTGELLVYLAARGSTTRESAVEALWPDEPANWPRFNQIVSDARRNALGPSGGEWLTTDGSRVGLECVTDWGLFRDDVADGEYDRALGHVRGRPLEGVLEGFEWMAAERAEMEAAIVDVARKVVLEGKAGGEWGRVKFAAARGLVVDEWAVDLVEAVLEASLALEDAGGAAWAQTRLDQLTAELEPDEVG